MFRLKKILVPLDGSPFAEQALEPAVAIAQAMSARLVLLRVMPPAQWVGDSIEVAWLNSGAAVKDWEEAKLYLMGLRAQLQNRRVPVQIETMFGPVDESIIDFVEANEVDLLVMASHERTGISRWLHRSVAEKVLHGTRRATLIIRAQDTSRRSTRPSRHPVRNVMAPPREAKSNARVDHVA